MPDEVLKVAVTGAVATLVMNRADASRLKQALDKSGITIPFPTSTQYHLEGGKPEKSPREKEDLPPPPGRDTSG